MQTVEHKAHWWLPSNPERQVPGKVTFSEEAGVTLELYGGLYESDPIDFQAEPAIFGQTHGGLPLTLDKAILTKINYRGHDANETRYKAHALLSGIRCLPSEELFDQMQVELTYLRDWAGITGITLGGPVDGPEIAYIEPEAVTTDFPWGMVSVRFGCGGSYSRFTARIEDNTSFYIKVNNPLTISEFVDEKALPLTDLINLGTGKANYLESLYLISTTNPQFPIQVFFPQSSFSSRDDETLEQEEMIFGLSRTRAQFEKLLRRWLEIWPDLKPMMDLFRQERSASKLFVHLRLLTVVQALEFYHRKRIKETANLKQRLDELLEPRRDLMARLVPDKIELLSEVTKNTRNYYTHFDEKIRDKSLHGEELFWLAETMSVLLQSCLLSELEVSPTDQRHWFSVSKTFYFLKQNAQNIVNALRSVSTLSK